MFAPIFVVVAHSPLLIWYASIGDEQTVHEPGDARIDPPLSPPREFSLRVIRRSLEVLEWSIGRARGRTRLPGGGERYVFV